MFLSFFESDEVARLESEVLEGHFINMRDPDRICSLKASVDDEISDRMITKIERDEERFVTSFYFKMKASEYELFKERGSRSLHEGYRHINLIDVSDRNKMSRTEKSAYNQLCHYQDRARY